MEMEEEGDVLSQQEEMPPAVSAVLDSTTELKRFFFPLHSLSCTSHPGHLFILLCAFCFLHLFYEIHFKVSCSSMPYVSEQSMALDT